MRKQTDMFKRREDILKADPIQEEIVILDEQTGSSKKLTLDAIYDYVESIELIDKVPEQVADHFSRAKLDFVQK